MMITICNNDEEQKDSLQYSVYCGFSDLIDVSDTL